MLFSQARNAAIEITANIETTLNGIPSSPGIVFGKTLVVPFENVLSPNDTIHPDKIDEELSRFHHARNELISELSIVIKGLQGEPGNTSAIIEANIMMLTDPVLTNSIETRIGKCVSAENAMIAEFDEQMQFFKRTQDKILRERGFELDHIKERLLRILRRRGIYYSLAKDTILIIRSLAAADFIQYKDAGLLGLITEVGGIASHTSILSRSYEIPSVIGLKNATELISDDVPVILDGYSGKVICNPTKETIDYYWELRQQKEEQKSQLAQLSKLSSETKDKHHIHLLTNIDSADEIDISKANGAEGIGLVRTEHMILSLATIPDQDEQYEWYREFAQRAYPDLVTIRAFDIGSDKFAEGLSMHEDNPALGFRGIRLLLSRKDIFRTQIKAVLRASRNRNIRFMLPMIISIEELDESISLMNECREQLKAEDELFDLHMPLGVMIETPSAAILSPELAKKVNFFSIGTNDLTQYSLATDRTNELVSNIFNAFHPTILRLIHLISKSASACKIPVGICGELGSHPAATEILIGLGINEFSVAPSMIPEIKNQIRRTSYKKASKLAKEVLKLSHQDEIRKILKF
jgi:phosphoenolpyruvate-protein phosphotransferase (PTS system enzyme I)